VRAGRRYLYDAQLLRVRAVPEDHAALARLSAGRLHRSGIPHSNAVAKELEDLVDKQATARALAAGKSAAADRAKELRLMVLEALKMWWAHQNEDLEVADDAQRRTMWLVCVGLAFVLVLGLTGDGVTLLAGALGGFLSPLLSVRERRIGPADHRTSWGILMLSPVAGALAAYAGVLLVGFLASDGVDLLGPLFTEAADDRTSGVSITIAILFGFSGRLFSEVALSAQGAITGALADKTDPDPDPSPDGPGDGGGDPVIEPTVDSAAAAANQAGAAARLAGSAADTAASTNDPATAQMAASAADVAALQAAEASVHADTAAAEISDQATRAKEQAAQAEAASRAAAKRAKEAAAARATAASLAEQARNEAEATPVREAPDEQAEEGTATTT
jgi:hypothetical protein